MNEKEKEDLSTEKGFWKNEFVVFLIGPIAFLIIVFFTGYQIFYNNHDNRKTRLKFVLLLSGGTLFYLIVIIVLITTTN